MIALYEELARAGKAAGDPKIVHDSCALVVLVGQCTPICMAICWLIATSLHALPRGLLGVGMSKHHGIAPSQLYMAGNDLLCNALGWLQLPASLLHKAMQVSVMNVHIVG